MGNVSSFSWSQWRRFASVVWFMALAMGCSGVTATASGDRGSSPDAPPVATAVPTATPEPTPTPEGPQPLRVVSIMGENGVMAPLDAPAVAGVAARIAQLNDDGGLLGQPIELLRFDSDSRTSVADRLADQLPRLAPDLVIVSCDVAFSKPVLDAASGLELITISPCADDPGYASAAWGPRNFALGAPAEPRGAVAAEVTLERYGATVIVLRDRTSPEALRFCNGFERAYRELGGTVLYRDEFNYDTPEPLLDRLKERGRPSDAIVLCSHVPGEADAAPNIIEQVRLLGFDAPLVSGSTLDESSWFAKAPLLGELTYVSWSSIFGNDPSTEVNALIELANDDADTPAAGVSTVLGADAIDLWAGAVTAARSAEPERVAAALASLVDQPLRTGEVTFAGGARLDEGRTYRVIRVVDSSVEEPELVTVDG